MTFILYQLNTPTMELILLAEPRSPHYRLQLTSRLTGQRSLAGLGDDRADAEAIYRATAHLLHTLTVSQPQHVGLPVTRLE